MISIHFRCNTCICLILRRCRIRRYGHSRKWFPHLCRSGKFLSHSMHGTWEEECMLVLVLDRRWRDCMGTGRDCMRTGRDWMGTGRDWKKAVICVAIILPSVPDTCCRIFESPGQACQNMLLPLGHLRDMTEASLANTRRSMLDDPLRTGFAAASRIVGGRSAPWNRHSRCLRRTSRQCSFCRASFPLARPRPQH